MDENESVDRQLAGAKGENKGVERLLAGVREGIMNHQTHIIDEMFKYNLWANTTMFDICSQLSHEQLQVEAEGVYGRILPLLTHIVRGENAYIRHLTGNPIWGAEFDWDSQSLEDLKAMAQQTGNRLIEIASNTVPTVEHFFEEDGLKYRFESSTVVIQALYHGIEHRTQMKVLLTKIGVEHPEMAGWDFGETIVG